MLVKTSHHDHQPGYETNRHIDWTNYPAHDMHFNDNKSVWFGGADNASAYFDYPSMSFQIRSNHRGDESSLFLNGVEISGAGDAITCGEVGMTNASRFHVKLTTNLSIPAATFTKINFNVEEFDTRSEFDLVNDKFQPDTAGYYQISFNCIMTSLDDAAYCLNVIQKNGANIAATRSARGNGVHHAGASVSVAVYLNGSSDYIEGFTYHSSAAAKNAWGSQPGYVQMSGHRLS